MRIGLITKEDTTVAQRGDVEVFSSADAFLSTDRQFDTLIVDARCNAEGQIREIIKELYRSCDIAYPIIFLAADSGKNELLDKAHQILIEGDEESLDDLIGHATAHCQETPGSRYMSLTTVLNHAVDRK